MRPGRLLAVGLLLTLTLLLGRRALARGPDRLMSTASCDCAHFAGGGVRRADNRITRLWQRGNPTTDYSPQGTWAQRLLCMHERARPRMLAPRR